MGSHVEFLRINYKIDDKFTCQTPQNYCRKTLSPNILVQFEPTLDKDGDNSP